MELISRKEAKIAGLKRYFTGKPCPNGHVAERFVTTCGCTACGLENNLKPENKAARARWLATEHGQATQKAGIKAWAEANKERRCETVKRYYRRNKEKANAYRQRHREENREREQAYMLAWQRANKEKCAAHSRRRQATERQSAAYLAAEKPFIQLMFNVFPGLKPGDFSCERLTFQPDTENV